MNPYNEIAFSTSKLVTTKYSTSFSVAVSFLSKEMKQAIYSIYGFVRLADEIVDTFLNINQKEVLDNFERDYYDSLARGLSMNPVIHAYILTVKKYNIPAHLTDSFLKSMRADLNKLTYNNTAELNEYIYGSADVVGLICLMIFVNGDERQYQQLYKPAMKLGSAFQKVNFLRDLKEDVENLDRNYFPDMDVTDFSETVKSKLIANIKIDFKEAKKGIKELPGKSRLSVFIAYLYYKKLLLNLEKTPANEIMRKRIRVPDSVKLILLGKAWVKYKLNLI